MIATGWLYQDRSALNLLVEEKLHRATVGGTGGVKSVTDYSPVSIWNSLLSQTFSLYSFTTQIIGIKPIYDWILI